MRAPMPRLVKDRKSGIWFFRWSLPKSHQQNLNQKRSISPCGPATRGWHNPMQHC